VLVALALLLALVDLIRRQRPRAKAEHDSAEVVAGSAERPRHAAD
jgi:hypothetical protein